MTGTQVLHYRVAERLGSGAMGDVFAAEDTRLGRRVALKFLPRAVQHDAASRTRLLNEARAAAALTSPYVAAMYDIGEHEGAPFIVMELVQGELLSTRLAKGPCSCDMAVDVMLQVAEALDEAHGRGIIHRDIKSANLMLTPRGLVKVLDFGVAKLLGLDDVDGAVGAAGATQGATLAGTLVGTVLYMSPEQADGHAVDPRSDLFSLGVVLYEMLAGRLPFTGASIPEVIDQIAHHTPPPPSRFNQEVDPALDQVVCRLIAKAPQERYASARDLIEDLRAVRPLSRLPLLPSTSPAPASGRVVAVVSFTNISQDVADDWIGAGMAETITADLKRLRGVAVVGRERMYDALAHLRTGEARPLDDRLAVDVGRALGADWIVAGGYQRLGSLIRLTARLVNVGTQSLTRTVKLDGELANLFALQDRIVAELVHWLEPDADTSDAWQPARDETASVEAYEAYARGMLNMRRATRESLDRAMYLFEQAVARDPRYALAWAALGETYEIKASMLGLRSFADRAIECMQRAVEVDPALADAHAELAWALLAAARHDEAITAARTAVTLEPSNARGHAALARAYWAGLGLIDEGIRELEIASSINPAAGYAFMQLGLLYALRGAYDLAEGACRRAIDLQEQYISGREGLLVVGARTRLGYVYYRRGRYDDALREYDRERAFLATTDHALRERTLIELNQKMGAAHLRLGNIDEARHRLDAAIAAHDERRAQGADEPFTTYYIAVAHALRGDAEAAVRLLKQTFTTLGALTRWRARHDPDFDGIRDTPAFVDALDAPPPSAALPAALSPTQA